MGTCPTSFTPGQRRPTMTLLRQRLIREMQLRQFSPRTIDSYVDAVAGLAAFYHRPPDQLKLEEVRSYLHHLLIERKLAQSTCNLRAAAITFFYRAVLVRKPSICIFAASTRASCRRSTARRN